MCSAIMFNPDPRPPLRSSQRLERQFQAFVAYLPMLERPLSAIRSSGWWIVRVPVAVLMIAGGLLSVLPFLGLWMLPFGLLLLAIDVPPLRDPMAGLIIRLRRRIDIWRRRFKR